MLIIPRDPSPDAGLPLHDRDLNSLSQPELVALLQQERAAKVSYRDLKDLSTRTDGSERSREDTKVNIKREREDDDTHSRKRARPSAGSIQFELDDDGSFRETSSSTGPAAKPEVIVLD